MKPKNWKSSYRLGVDIGGTFTDIVLTTNSGRLGVQKILSTPENYADGVISGVLSVLKSLDISVEGSSDIVHATTVATNAILERSGARCALITTVGFRDVLEIGRLRIPELFNPFYDKRPVLIPRDRIVEVDERINHRGEVITALDEAEMQRILDAISVLRVESVAICLINSYVNPIHEQTITKALRERMSELDVSTSADVLPRIREYERTSTTAINAYVQPTVRAYIESLTVLLKQNDILGSLLIMQSGGGLMGANRAAREPVTMIESGPAAGVLAARHFLTGIGLKNAITFDMGGTTAKASIIENGTVLKTTEYEVGGDMSATSRLTGGGGYPLSVSAIDIAEVGAGGGSIVWLDSGGSLRVGPQSASAVPGPVCYGGGGQQPTVTDANLILGYLNPQHIAGGAIKLDIEAAREALQDRVARPLGLTLADAAFGVHRIANSEMMGAIRAVSTQRGRDVRDFAMVAFGGSGPAHAAQLAQELAISTVIIPPYPGLFSAFGLLATELEVERTRTLYVEANELRESNRLSDILSSLRSEVEDELSRETNTSELRFEVAADMCYRGQSYELEITAPADLAPTDLVNSLVSRFEIEHENTYGHRAENEQVIIAAIRLIARVPAAPFAIEATGSGAHVSNSRHNGAHVSNSRHNRDAWFGPEFGWLATPVLNRTDIGSELSSGPLLIEEYDSVIVVPPNCSAKCTHAGGSLEIVIEETRMTTIGIKH
jgi:N-methylhydantoinase A